MTNIFTWIGLGLLITFAFWKFLQAMRNREILDALLNSLKEKGIRNKAIKYIEAIDMVMDFSFPEANKAYKKYSIFLSLSLYRSLIPFLAEMLHSDPGNRRASTIVGIMIGEKIRQAFVAQIWLTISIAISLAFDFFLGTRSGVWTIAISGLSLLAIQIDHKLLEYRIRRGIYGSNAFETLEIINFIIKHSNKDDFNDEGGLKRVIPSPEAIREEVEHSAKGGAYV